MHYLNKINIASITPQNRALIWILLLILTATLLLFPVQLINQYHPIQAPYIFENLPVFGTLFCIWILLLIFLVFSKRDERTKLDWENLGLACIFGLVFLGFWVIIAPYGSFADNIFNLGHAKWLADEGSIAIGHQNLWYFDFPGIHIICSVLSGITRLEILESATFFLLLNDALFIALLFILLATILKSNKVAFLGVLLVVLSSAFLVEKMHIFTPGALGYTLFAALLIMIARSKEGFFETTVSTKVLMLILFAATVVSYFATSFLLPLVLLGIYVVQTLAGDREKRGSLMTIALLVVLVIAWEIYWTSKIYGSLVSFLPRLWEQIVSGEFLSIPRTLAGANVGGRLPLWATATRLFWWTLLGFSIIVGFYNLLRVKTSNRDQKILTGGLLGVLLLTLVGIFGTHGGQQFTRFLLYAPLFCIPILLMYVSKTRIRRKMGFVPIILLVFVLSLPTFLSSVNLVGTEAVRAQEFSAGEFVMNSTYQNGASCVLISPTYVSSSWAYYFIPGCRIEFIPQEAFYEKGKDEFWQEMDKMIEDFKIVRPWEETQKIFTISNKDMTFCEHVLDIPKYDPKWNLALESLSTGNKIFDNSYTTMYTPCS